MESRLFKHIAGATHSTNLGIPWGMVNTESFQNKHDVIVREREIIDKKSRSYIENMIKSRQS
jgi:hypothetical protein